MEPDWVVEVGGADSMHTSTRAYSESARVTSAVGMKVSMVSLTRSRPWRRIICDDVQGSASTLEAGSVEGIPLLLAE